MTAVAARRTVFALLGAALILGVCGNCRWGWQRTDNQPARPVIADAAVEPTLTPPSPVGSSTGNPKSEPGSVGTWTCGPVPSGGTFCTTGDLPGPQGRMVAVALLDLRVFRSLVPGGAP